MIQQSSRSLQRSGRSVATIPRRQRIQRYCPVRTGICLVRNGPETVRGSAHTSVCVSKCVPCAADDGQGRTRFLRCSHGKYVRLEARGNASHGRCVLHMTVWHHMSPLHPFRVHPTNRTELDDAKKSRQFLRISRFPPMPQTRQHAGQSFQQSANFPAGPHSIDKSACQV